MFALESFFLLIVRRGETIKVQRTMREPPPFDDQTSPLYSSKQLGARRKKKYRMENPAVR